MDVTISKTCEQGRLFGKSGCFGRYVGKSEPHPMVAGPGSQARKSSRFALNREMGRP